jgi:hypothetical protein
MKTQKPLPNPPEQYEPEYMYDLSSLIISEEAITCKTSRDNVFDTGSVILRSPNGSYFKIVVSDAGSLSATAVTTVGNRPITSTNPHV